MELQTRIYYHRLPCYGVHANRLLFNPYGFCRNHKALGYRAPHVRVLRAVPRAEVQSVEESKVTTTETQIEEQLKLSQRKITSPVIEYDVVDPIPGKSGTLSFQDPIEASFSSTYSEKEKGSVLWFLAPVALISAFAVPPWFIGTALDMLNENKVFAELLTVVSSEIIFYVGVWIFLTQTNRIQRPFLQFGPKRWSLITGLNGYMFCYYVSLGMKVFLPFLMMLSAQKYIGMPAIVAMAPFVMGCIVEICFGVAVERRRWSCWPIVPIIFEVYRLYQACRGGFFMERLLLGTRQLQPLGARSPEQIFVEFSMVGVIIILKISFMISLFSQLAFLVRLFPSRPVSKRY